MPAMPAPTTHTSALVSSVKLPSDGISSEDAIQIEVVCPESLSIACTSLLDKWLLISVHLFSPENPLRAVSVLLSRKKRAPFFKKMTCAALYMRVEILGNVREVPPARP